MKRKSKGKRNSGKVSETNDDTLTENDRKNGEGEDLDETVKRGGKRRKSVSEKRALSEESEESAENARSRSRSRSQTSVATASSDDFSSEEPSSKKRKNSRSGKVKQPEDNINSSWEDSPTESSNIKRKDNKNDESEDSSNEEEEEYQVDKIINDKMVRGKKHYLVRWKGYGIESDSWEPESNLNCTDAINDYIKNQKLNNTLKVKKRASTKLADEEEETWSENENFEVNKILDVYFRKDGTKEFLVSWKGYAARYDSWEPEENLNCKDLVERYMKKCDKAREASQKELRVNRKVTNRFTLTFKDSGRRSKRNQGKQRVHYHDAE